MSLHPQAFDAVPTETARIAQAAFPHGNVHMRIRDEVGALYANKDFVTLFGVRGQPAEAP